jgi:hypothetical protein
MRIERIAFQPETETPPRVIQTITNTNIRGTIKPTKTYTLCRMTGTNWRTLPIDPQTRKIAYAVDGYEILEGETTPRLHYTLPLADPRNSNAHYQKLKAEASTSDSPSSTNALSQANLNSFGNFDLKPMEGFKPDQEFTNTDANHRKILYISNLAEHVNESSLQELFSSYGKILVVFLFKSRSTLGVVVSCGLVQFSKTTTQDSIQQAIQLLDRTIVDGRKIFICSGVDRFSQCVEDAAIEPTPPSAGSTSNHTSTSNSAEHSHSHSHSHPPEELDEDMSLSDDESSHDYHHSPAGHHPMGPPHGYRFGYPYEYHHGPHPGMIPPPGYHHGPPPFPMYGYYPPPYGLEPRPRVRSRVLDHYETKKKRLDPLEELHSGQELVREVFYWLVKDLCKDSIEDSHRFIVQPTLPDIIDKYLQEFSRLKPEPPKVSKTKQKTPKRIYYIF